MMLRRGVNDVVICILDGINRIVVWRVLRNVYCEERELGCGNNRILVQNWYTLEKRHISELLPGIADNCRKRGMSFSHIDEADFSRYAAIHPEKISTE